MRSAVVLLSGGVDSTTLLHSLARDKSAPTIHALSFRYGQKHARELRMAAWQAAAAGIAAHRVVDIAPLAPLFSRGSALTDASVAVPALRAVPRRLRGQPPTYVPNRNMILLALAAGYAEANGIADVFYGAQAQDAYGYWDCTAGFVRRLNRALALNRGRGVTVHAPFAALPKARVLAAGLALGVDYSRTWTCYRGGVKPCGDCPSCVERAAAFRAVGTADPLITRFRPAHTPSRAVRQAASKSTSKPRRRKCPIPS